MPKQKQRKRKQRQSAEQRFVRPTSEREAHNDTESAGAARRITPPIDTLHRQNRLTRREWEALRYYGQQASLAETSPVRSMLDRSPRGNGHGPGAAIVSAMIETGRLEREMGRFRNIARAVVVDYLTLSQWLIQKHGGRERKGKSPEPLVPVETGLADLKCAAACLIALQDAA